MQGADRNDGCGLDAAAAPAIQSGSDAVVVAWCIMRTLVGLSLWLPSSLRNDALTASCGSALITMGILGLVLRKVSARESWSSRLSLTDALTGLPNRRRFDRCLARKWSLAMSSGWPLGLILIDVDHFKSFNDHQGRPAGDRCLREVADALRRAMRPCDLLARYGGEEFVILLPRTDAATTQAIAERLRLSVVARGICREDRMPGLVTASLGAVALIPTAGIGAAILVEEAEAALYRAKRHGRNRVCGSSQTTSALLASCNLSGRSHAVDAMRPTGNAAGASLHADPGICDRPSILPDLATRLR